jgi:hypothetical protein
MDTTPRYNDPDNTLLKKICLLLQGGIASGVLTFNSRTGAITLLSSDVTGALGYTPVNKAGDTMSGTLTLPTLASTTAINGVDETLTGTLNITGAQVDHVVGTRLAADTQGATVRLRKRGTTGNANAAVADNQGVFQIRALAWDGTDYQGAGRFQVNAQGAQGAGNRSTYLRWQACPPSTTTEEELFRVTSRATAQTFLTLGGVANTNPAIKRVGTDVQIRLGNDSGYAAIDASVLKTGGTQVVDSRKTGWTAATGTAARTTFATSTVTTEELAKRVKALIDDLISHGLIGA